MRCNFFTLCLALAITIAACGCTPRQRDPIGHYVEGRILADIGELDAALKELNMAVKDDPELSIAYSAAGDIHFGRGNYKKARGSYEKACKSNPYSFGSHYKLGVTYEKLAEVAQTAREVAKLIRAAVSVYLRSVELEPGDFDANINLCACYFRLGKYRLAEKYGKAAIKADPKNPKAHSNIAVILTKRGQYREAIAHINSARALLTDEHSQRYRTILAESLEKLQKHLAASDQPPPGP